MQEPILRTCPKTLKNLHDSSLEIFNKTQWFLQKPLHLVICELSSNSNIVKFLCEFPHLEVLGQVLNSFFILVDSHKAITDSKI
ncbi:hypothetical protein BEN42_19390 [Leptospira interrogans serovar Canicola]|nr:hypothetical protein [Leptospira interrogans serovar Canicola]